MSELESMERLIESFCSLPTVGKKTAQRYVYSIINMPKEDVERFSQNLLDVKNKIKFCSRCGNWAEDDICDICKTRNNGVIVVVKEPKDIVAMERVRGYKGTYHVLQGTLNPMEGKGPNDIRIKELLKRISEENIQEIVLALNSDVNGEATSMYLVGLLKPLNIKVSRLAQGIAMGGDIEYQDEITLSRAFEDRKVL